MWRILSLIYILFSCHPDSQEKSKYEGNIFLLKKLIVVQQQLDSVVTDNVYLKEMVDNAKSNNMALIAQALDYKESRLETKYIEKKMQGILLQKDEIIKEQHELRKKYEVVIKENEGIKYTLNNEREIHRSTIKQKAELEQSLSKASELSITSVHVVGLGSSFNPFGKSKDVETNKTNKIKKIRVSFSLPSNPVAIQEKKNISIVIYSTDKTDMLQKDTTIYYSGLECPMKLTLNGKEFKTGKHLVKILLNGKLKSENEFTVVNN